LISPTPIPSTFKVSVQQTKLEQSKKKEEPTQLSHRSHKIPERVVSPRKTTYTSLKFTTSTTRNKIYKITTTFPVSKPYATQMDFEKTIQKYRIAQ
jgi:hypothetical protein